MSRRGLDLTDESFYLLSYRWWDTNPRTFTGAQYLYGPVFELMGYDVQGLRLLRLAALVLAHGALAQSVAGYLRVTGRARWSYGVPVRLLLVSLGGISYGWLPQAPGYNDVALLAALLLVAVVLVVASRQVQGAPPPLLALTASGWCLGVLALAKWSAALTVGTMFLAAVVVLTWRLWRHLAASLTAVTVGAVAWMFAVQVTVGPWSAILEPMREVNALVTAETNSPLWLIVLYLRTTGWLLLLALLVAALAVLPVAMLRRRRSSGAVVGGWSLVLAAALPWLLTRELPLGGPGQAWAFSLSLTSLTLATVLTALTSKGWGGGDAETSRHARPREWVVLCVLTLAPAAQAFGTGNPLYLLAISGFAFWGAAVLVLISRNDSPEARATTLGYLLTASVLIALIATTALLLNPYRSADVSEATTEVTRADTLDGLLLEPTLASDLDSLVERVDAEAPAESAVYAVDELAGAVLALDRPPAGEAWTSRLDNIRSAAGLRSWCARHPDAPPPVVVADRPLSRIDREALHACGWPFYPSFRVLPSRFGPDDLRVYVPQSR
jgi:hypothetical protein